MNRPSTRSTPSACPPAPTWTTRPVRAAWRAIAAATHPDRPDGGDLARYTQATAAYAELRTPWGRSEAYADLLDSLGNGRATPTRTAARPARPRRPRDGCPAAAWQPTGPLLARSPPGSWHGRPLRLLAPRRRRRRAVAWPCWR